MAESIDGQLKGMMQDLKDIINHVNSSNVNLRDSEDPVCSFNSLIKTTPYVSVESNWGMGFSLISLLFTQFSLENVGKKFLLHLVNISLIRSTQRELCPKKKYPCSLT